MNILRVTSKVRLRGYKPFIELLRAFLEIAKNSNEQDAAVWSTIFIRMLKLKLETKIYFANKNIRNQMKD